MSEHQQDAHEDRNSRSSGFHLVSFSEDNWDAGVKVHLKGTYCVTQPVFRWMKEMKRPGVIVNTSSSEMVAQWSPDRVAPVVLYMVSRLSGDRTNKTLFASGSKVMELKMVSSHGVPNGESFDAHALAAAADRVFLPEQALDFNA